MTIHCSSQLVFHAPIDNSCYWGTYYIKTPKDISIMYQYQLSV